MLKFVFVLLLALGLAGCASKAPAPVADTRSPVRVEAQKSVPPPASAASAPAARRTAPADGAEVRAIAAGGGVAARPLDDAPVEGVTAPLTPSLSLSNAEVLKRAPRGGKLPYSEANLALLKAQEGAAVPVTAPPVVPTVAPAPSVSPALPAPAEANGIEWGWPATGRILASFSDGAGGQEMNRGIDIAGKPGDPVLAAAAGKVIYVGVQAKYGNLVIVLHQSGYSTVYAHNSRIHVKEGQLVKHGEKIADLGKSDADQTKLHFELRRQGRPLDPLKFLPAR